MITYMLVSGGISPFFHRNSHQLEANIVAGSMNMEHQALHKVTTEAKSFIQSLLVVEPGERWSAKQCLKHKWLYSVDLGNPHRSEERRLETQAMRGFLARGRWARCCSAVRATLRIVRRGGGKKSQTPSYLCSDRELWLRSSMLISSTYGRWRIAYM